MIDPLPVIVEASNQTVNNSTKDVAIPKKIKFNKAIDAYIREITYTGLVTV